MSLLFVQKPTNGKMAPKSSWVAMRDDLQSHPRPPTRSRVSRQYHTQANVMIGNLWQDKGNRFVDQTTQHSKKDIFPGLAHGTPLPSPNQTVIVEKKGIVHHPLKYIQYMIIDGMQIVRHNWIELQSVFVLIKQAYDNAHIPAYTRVLSGQVGTGISQTSWNAMTPQKRATIAERIGEKEGKRAVNTWIAQAESQLNSLWGPLAMSQSIARAWVEWKINYQLDREHVYLKEHATQHFNESDVVPCFSITQVALLVASLPATKATHSASPQPPSPS